MSSLTQKQPNKPRKKNKKREPPTVQKPTTPDEGQEEQPPALQEVTVAPECLQDGPRPQKQELEEVNLAPKGMPPKPIFLAKDLPAEKKKAFIALIRECIDVFAWNYDEMPGLDPRVTTHKLNVVPSARPVKQGVRFYKPDVELKIKDEVVKLLKAGFIKPIQEVSVMDEPAEMRIRSHSRQVP
ncbi:hypothetical protein RHSIM_RhsimUnG0112100 [Rhododendron simsii]|uniref:Uncharacterized protein n=1 Tax=Rhododendron simsii TaxID=118357 RepID=A0A834FYE8_RHOSS|nr:hypothetical protein RHSIM_RhsimUnG0112100 [Rhododendron simsii]